MQFPTIVPVLMVATLIACQAPGPGATAGGGGSAGTAAAPTAASGAAPAPESTPAPAALDRVQVAYASATAGFAAPWLAKEMGLFEKHGLDATVTFIQSGPTLTQSLIAGELHFGEVAAPAPMAAHVEGAPIVWIAVSRRTPVFALMARPEVRGVDDLRGRGVGVTRLGTTTHTFAKLAMRSVGLDPERDVQMVGTGGQAETVGALLNGRVAAGIMGPPGHLVAVQEGMHVLLDLTELGIRWPIGGIATTREQIAAHPERARRFLMAYSEAVHVIRTDRERGIAAMAHVTSTTDRAIAEQTWEIHGKHFTFPPYPEREDMVVAVREELALLNPRALEVAPEAFYDDRILRDLEREGFFTRVGPTPPAPPP